MMLTLEEGRDLAGKAGLKCPKKTKNLSAMFWSKSYANKHETMQFGTALPFSLW